MMGPPLRPRGCSNEWRVQRDQAPGWPPSFLLSRVSHLGNGVWGVAGGVVTGLIPHRDSASFNQFLVRSLSSWTITRGLPLKENPTPPWGAFRSNLLSLQLPWTSFRAFHVYSQGTMYCHGLPFSICSFNGLINTLLVHLTANSVRLRSRLQSATFVVHQDGLDSAA